MTESDDKTAAHNAIVSSFVPDATVDLKGKKCPMTFVYTKLELEKLQTHQILRVILDYPPSFSNVPRSVNLQGLGDIVKESEGDPGEKILWIRKK